MFFKASTIAFLAATAVFAAPVEQTQEPDISVLLTGKGATSWRAVGFSATEALQASSSNPGPFTHVQLLFSDKIKKERPGIEKTYRCALQDKDGNRIITTRGTNIDFNFGDNNNPNAWTLKNGPFGNLKVLCDPKFLKVSPDDVNDIRVTLSDSGAEFARQLSFKAADVAKKAVSINAGGAFKNVKLFVGPGVDNQKLRCQITDTNGDVILVDRGANKNKETFGDAGKGEWTLDVAGDGIANVKMVTCDPKF